MNRTMDNNKYSTNKRRDWSSQNRTSKNQNKPLQFTYKYDNIVFEQMKRNKEKEQENNINNSYLKNNINDLHDLLNEKENKERI